MCAERRSMRLAWHHLTGGRSAPGTRRGRLATSRRSQTFLTGQRRARRRGRGMNEHQPQKNVRASSHWLGERGVRAAGGQRQPRVFAGTLLLRDPKILLLDEATSSWTRRASTWCRRRGELTKDRTTLVVAHRLSTVRKAGTIDRDGGTVARDDLLKCL